MIEGYSIDLANGEESFRRKFDIHSLANVAQRHFLNLVNEKIVELGDSFKYFLTTVPAEPSATSRDEPHQVKTHDEPLALEPARLADFLDRSEPFVGVSEPPDESVVKPMPMFIEQAAWEASREQAFRGGDNETAALFSGRLLRDIDSPEVFVCLDACLEAVHAVEEKLSVAFTGETWAHARKLLATRRRRLNRPHEIFVASVHRHPFAPAADAQGRRKCDVCDVAKYCNRSTAVPSTDDFDWHRSVFAAQPWATLLLWGYNAREEEDFRCYGLQNATFTERTIHILKH